MAVQFDNNVSEWSRTTVADGKWLNKNTIRPLIERTEILRDAINDMADSDNTIYGIFSSTSGAGYSKGGWELTESNGNLTTDGFEICGLKDNKVYHIEISGYYTVNTPNDIIITAYLLDSNGKKLYFNVNTSNSGLVVPVTFAYSFIPTTNLDTETGTYKYKLLKWTSMDEDGHEDTEAEESAISLYISDISIYEIANKTISVSVPKLNYTV